MTTNTAWDRAVSEGLSYFWVTMHVGHTIEFVGTSWEDGGFSTDDEGQPVCDGRGNTVARGRQETLDPENADHVTQVEEWYS